MIPKHTRADHQQQRADHTNPDHGPREINARAVAGVLADLQTIGPYRPALSNSVQVIGDPIFETGDEQNKIFYQSFHFEKVIAASSQIF